MDCNEAKHLAYELLSKYDLDDHAFRWMKATTMYGLHKRREKIIKLGIPFVTLNNQEVVEHMILHEIAHAIDCRRRGESKHDKIFRSICKEIGCNQIYSAMSKNIVEPETKRRPEKYEIRCGICGSEKRLSQFHRCGDKYYVAALCRHSKDNYEAYEIDDKGNRIKDISHLLLRQADFEKQRLATVNILTDAQVKKIEDTLQPPPIYHQDKGDAPGTATTANA